MGSSIPRPATRVGLSPDSRVCCGRLRRWAQAFPAARSAQGTITRVLYLLVPRPCATIRWVRALRAPSRPLWASVPRASTRASLAPCMPLVPGTPASHFAPRVRDAAHGVLCAARGPIHPTSLNPGSPAVRFAPRVREAARGVLHAAGGRVPRRINCSIVSLINAYFPTPASDAASGALWACPSAR